MGPIRAYKALGYQIFIFNRRLFDLLLSAGFSFLLAVIFSYLVGLACFLFLYLKVTKDFKYRPRGYFPSGWLFLATPRYMSVKPLDDEIPTYSKVIAKCG